MPSSFAQYFNSAWCINLQERTQRWFDFSSQIGHDWPSAMVARFDAVNGHRVVVPDWYKAPPGAWGCLMSHMRIWEDALTRGFERVLVFEDDAVFCDGFVEKAELFLDAVPKGWDQLYFGGRPLGRARRVNNLVVEPKEVINTQAYAISNKFMRRMYGIVADLPRYELPWQFHVDRILANEHRKPDTKIYCPSTLMVGQRAGDSDIGPNKHRTEFWNEEAWQPRDESLIAVLAAPRAGGSCVASILDALGAWGGTEFRPADIDNPQGSFEPLWLGNQIYNMIDRESLVMTSKPDDRQRVLRQWLDSQMANHKGGAHYFLKHPMLPMMLGDLEQAHGEILRKIVVRRSINDIILSFETMLEREWSPTLDVESYLRRFTAEIDQATTDDCLVLDYDEILRSPHQAVQQIREFCNLPQNPSRTKEAVSRVAAA